jgi:hypothetical protein
MSRTPGGALVSSAIFEVVPSVAVGKQRKRNRELSTRARATGSSPSGATRGLFTPTSQQSAGFLRFRKRGSVVVFAGGLLFLGTTGVQFVVDGNPRGETGFFLGIIMVAVGVHQWTRLRKIDLSE